MTRLLADLELFRGLGHRPPLTEQPLSLPQCTDDLLRRMPPSLHVSVPSSSMIVDARTSHKARTDPQGSGRRPSCIRLREDGSDW